MGQILTSEEKKEVLLNVLKELAPNVPIFGVDNIITGSLISDGIVYQENGGVALTEEGREFVETLSKEY